MDDNDCRGLFNFQFGPTVLQVASGTYAAFLWGCLNPLAGSHYPETIDKDFILNKLK